MIVPLGKGAYKRTDGFTPEVVCRNMYLEEDKSGLSPDGLLRIQRPGLISLYTLADPIRGVDYRLVSNERITFAGSSLYSNGVAKGVAPGMGIVPSVETPFVFAFVGGTNAYLYDNTAFLPENAVTLITMPDSRAVTDVDQLNGYVMLACPDGRFYWLEPGQTTVDPLNFATAESSPDGTLAVRRVGDEIWFFGQETVEPWQATGDADAPFQRATGRQYDRGCMSRDTVRRFDNSVVWVSNDGNVCRGEAVPRVISDNGIAERIRKRTGNLSAWTFRYDGHEFYVLRIPGQGTFAMDALTSEWCEFATTGRTVWAPHVGYDRNGEIVCGDSDTGAVWQLDAVAATDAGIPFERVLTATVGFTGVARRNDSLSVGVGTSADIDIRIRWKDGQDDYPVAYEEVEARAPLDIATIYRLGQPDQPYRTVEISYAGPERIRIAGCVEGQGWQ